MTSTRSARRHRPGPALHGLDIETDTSVGGLDPAVARILAVAVVSPEGAAVFDDADEAALLDRLDWHLAGLEPGVLATWNGGAFDLPFIADRARRCGVDLGLRLAPDPSVVTHHPPLAGHRDTYRATWHAHAHLDVYRVFRPEIRAAFGVPCSLKSVARLAGLRPVEVDASRVHLLGRAELHDYVASDASCTRTLALRRWPTARLAVDQPASGPHPGRVRS